MSPILNTYVDIHHINSNFRKICSVDNKVSVLMFLKTKIKK